MIIEYVNDMNDLMEYQKYHFNNSPQTKRQILIGRIILPIVLVIIIGIFYIKLPFEIIFKENWYWLIISLLWLILYPYYYRFSSYRNAKKMQLEGKNKDVLCKHKLIIDEDKIIDETENNRSEFRWKGIEKIVYSTEYIFVYVSAVGAHIIPLKYFKDDIERNAYIALLKKYNKLNIDTAHNKA